MSGIITFLAVVVLFAVLAAYARKMQQGGFSKEELRSLGSRTVAGGIVLVIVIILASSIVTVPVGHRMVVYNQITHGFRTPIKPGYAFVLPLFYERVLYDVRTQVYTMSSIPEEGDVRRSDAIEVLSLEAMTMFLDVTVRYVPVEGNINDLHAKVGKDYVDKIIRPTVHETIRNEFATYAATEAVTLQRDEITSNLDKKLKTALAKYFIELERIQIRNIVLPEKLVAEIEEKNAAQQQAERMIHVLAKERQEKERIQIEAEAQAERIRIVNEALASNPNYLNWLAIDKLNDNINLVISDGKTILNLDAMQAD